MPILLAEHPTNMDGYNSRNSMDADTCVLWTAENDQEYNEKTTSRRVAPPPPSKKALLSSWKSKLSCKKMKLGKRNGEREENYDIYNNNGEDTSTNSGSVVDGNIIIEDDDFTSRHQHFLETTFSFEQQRNIKSPLLKNTDVSTFDKRSVFCIISDDNRDDHRDDQQQGTRIGALHFRRRGCKDVLVL
eukprot:scaffold8444_cov56-Cylindrotheca_fusiformis.AAC.1